MKKLLLKDQLNGWIDERGNFFPCNYGEHNLVYFSYMGHKRIKISEYDGGTIFVSHIPTQAQINKVYDWCEENDRIDLWEQFKEDYL
jgi:hypothetical protein